MMRVYGIDLLDLWRGTLTLRRVHALLSNLPAGSALARATGGNAAMSEETWALLVSAWRLECRLLDVNGVKPSKWPKPPKAPAATHSDTSSRQKTKAERWLARHPEITSAMT